jgi:hypothetical protein
MAPVSSESSTANLAPHLPADRTFVVQFRATPAEAERDLDHGRVEHLVSGQAARFDTWNDLHAFVEHVLVDAEPSGHGGEEPR